MSSRSQDVEIARLERLVESRHIKLADARGKLAAAKERKKAAAKRRPTVRKT